MQDYQDWVEIHDFFNGWGLWHKESSRQLFATEVHRFLCKNLFDIPEADLDTAYMNLTEAKQEYFKEHPVPKVTFEKIAIPKIKNGPEIWKKIHDTVSKWSATSDS